MKLLRYGPVGAEKPGLLDADGHIRDLSHVHQGPRRHAVGADRAGDAGQARSRLAAARVAAARAWACRSPRSASSSRSASTIVDHAAESNLPIPKEPIVFTKAISCLQRPERSGDAAAGTRSRATGRSSSASSSAAAPAMSSEADALDHVAGYCLINDVSEREYQIERGGTWDKGKGCDTFGPVGPWLVTADEVGDPQDARHVARRQRQARCRPATPRR